MQYYPWNSSSYGQPDGILGINCRHHKYPFTEGVSLQSYFPTENMEANNKLYKKTQVQRALERDVRKQKRECMIYDELDDKENFKNASVKLKQKEAKLKAYVEGDKDLHRRKDREQVVGFGRGTGARAVAAKNKSVQELDQKNADKPVAKASSSGTIKTDRDTSDVHARHLYDNMSREERTEVIRRGQEAKKAVFSYDRPDNDAMSRLQKVTKKDWCYDVLAHGSPNSIEFFKQDYPEGDRRRSIDAYTLSCILKGREDYQEFINTCRKAGKQPMIRMLSCSTGDTSDTGDCFAQLLANEMGINVEAPTDLLYAINNDFYIGDAGNGEMKQFYSRK